MDAEKAQNFDEPTGQRENARGAVTQILDELRQGDMEARARLVAIVYQDLHELAAAQLRRERGGHTLQPTALVHEAFLKLFGGEPVAWENRAHFFGAAAEAMRRILVDFARRRQARKRGSGFDRVELDDEIIANDRAATVLAVDEALSGLAAHNERMRKLVELRFFVGLTLEESAEALGYSLATIKRDWAYARAWLMAQLGDREQPTELDG